MILLKPDSQKKLSLRLISTKRLLKRLLHLQTQREVRYILVLQTMA
jgi:hypothetical protein